MAQTTINFSYKDKDYELKYTRDTVRQMQNNGFSLSYIDTKSIDTIEKLFAGAFLAKHKSTKKDLVLEIFAKMPDKEKLLEKLLYMYEETLETLMEEPSDDEKLEWTVNE